MNRLDELEGAIAQLSECRQQLNDIYCDEELDFNKSIEVVNHYLLALNDFRLLNKQGGRIV